MKLTLIGIGGGGKDTITVEAQKALAEADFIIGAKRMVEAVSPTQVKTVIEYKPNEIIEILKNERPNRACILYSGDTGFYSGANTILQGIWELGYIIRILPGVSSFQYLSAALGRPWQDWRFVSAHGKDCDPVWEVMQGKPVLFLTSGAETVRYIGDRLMLAGLGELKATLGENLSYDNQSVLRGTVEEISKCASEKLSVLLVEPAPQYIQRSPGLPDELFIRGNVPMTKQEVRSVILAKLGVRPDDVCWDVGAGTGSVAIELSRLCMSVWAIEQKDEAYDLILQNREKFCAWNLNPVYGNAPDALAKLPAPDAVFIGGSSGKMSEIIETVCRINNDARICVTAIALETLHEAVEALTRQGYTPEITQISVSRTKAVNGLSMLTAQNPIFIISGEKK